MSLWINKCCTLALSSFVREWLRVSVCLQVFLKQGINEPFYGSASITGNKILSQRQRQKLHQKFLCSRRVTCGNRVKVSSITSSGESIKPDLHKEGPDWIPAELSSAVTLSVEWATLIEPICPVVGFALPLSPSFPFTMVNFLPVTQTFLPQ